MAKHVHSEVIKAWADGAEIEYKSTLSGGLWRPLDYQPSWDPEIQYRVKPKQQERWVNIFDNNFGFSTKEDADAYAAVMAGGSLRTACIKIIFNEGEGL